jgi:hypothetical protein
MEFSASLDTTAKVVTTGVFILFTGIAVWNARTMKKAQGDKVGSILRIGIFVILAFSIGMSFAYSTKGYETKGKSLIIKNRFSEIPLTYKDMADARLITEDEMKSLGRGLGIGGLFGYYGHYHNSSIGDMTFYGTQQKNWVLIHTVNGESIVLTPDEPDKFLTEVKSIITPNN